MVSPAEPADTKMTDHSGDGHQARCSVQGKPKNSGCVAVRHIPHFYAFIGTCLFLVVNFCSSLIGCDT